LNLLVEDAREETESNDLRVKALRKFGGT